MSHVTRMNESCHWYGWVMSCDVNAWHNETTNLHYPVQSIDVSCHTHEWVTSHAWRSHFTRTNESFHTYGWVISHVWVISAHMRSKYACVCVCVRVYMYVCMYAYMTVCMLDKDHWWFFLGVVAGSWASCRCYWTHVCWQKHWKSDRDNPRVEIETECVCDMTLSHVWHDWFMCVTWLIHVCNMTDSCV